MTNKKSYSPCICLVFFLLLFSLASFAQVAKLKMKDQTERQEKIKNINEKFLFVPSGKIRLTDIQLITFAKPSDIMYDEYRLFLLKAGVEIAFDGVERIENSPIVQSISNTSAESVELRLQDLENRVQAFRINRALGKGLQIGGSLISLAGSIVTLDKGKVSPLIYVGSGISFTGWVIDVGAGSKLKKKKP
jgi:hypothetical protein